MRFDIGQKIIAALLIVGGLVTIVAGSVALGGGVLPLPVWALYMTPFALCVVAGVGLWRDAVWGQWLAVAMLLAQLVFVSSEPFGYGLYTGAVAATIATFPVSGLFGPGTSGSLDLYLALGSDFYLAVGNESAPVSLGLNLVPLAGLIYLFRARPAARDVVTGKERVSVEHRDDWPSLPARHTLAPEGHLLGTGLTEAPTRSAAQPTPPRAQVPMPGGAL